MSGSAPDAPDPIARGKSSPSRKPCSSRRRWRRTAQPQAVRAVSYSEKAGAVISAVCGLRASTARKIKSAAPLPQSTNDSGTPSCAAIARDSDRHSGSGYRSADAATCRMAFRTPGGTPSGLTFAEKSSGWPPYSS